jgi:hypothetical protein
MECVLSTPELGQPQQNTHICTQNPWHTNKNLEPKMQNWQKRGDEKIPKTKPARARAPTYTHTHTKYQKNHKTPKSLRNTKPNYIQATQQRAPHLHEQQCIISHKKKLIIERGCQERKEKKPPQPPEKKKKKCWE